MRQQLSIPPAGNSWDSKEILDVSLLHGAIWISEFLKRGHLKEQRWRISGWVCGLWELGLTCPFNPPPTSLIPVRVTSLPDLSSRVQGRLRGMPLRCRASQGPGISLWFRMRAAFIVFMENPDVFELETMLMELARDGGKGSWSVREVRFMVLRFSGTLTGALREESSKLKWVCCNWDCILRSNRLGASWVPSRGGWRAVASSSPSIQGGNEAKKLVRGLPETQLIHRRNGTWPQVWLQISFSPNPPHCFLTFLKLLTDPLFLMP